MIPPRVGAFVMAGGEGARLRPFTFDCPKPALPFGGAFRVIDFALSNLYNSGVPRAWVLVQYQPEQLVAHLARSWGDIRTDRGPFVRVLTPQEGSAGGFRGTADAVAQCLHALDRELPDVVAVFAADHVYRMDVRQMLAFHAERDADATVAAVPVPIGNAGEFGVICADGDGRIRAFQEKPARPQAMPGDPARVYASMGNYLFRPATLRAALADSLARGEHDFGRHVLPRLVHTHRVFAYDFGGNRVPGIRACEEPAYWRDVGTVDAYVQAHWDLLGPDPRFCLRNPQWPIRGAERPLMLEFGDGGAHVGSIAGPGALYEGASIRHSVLQRGAHVETGADVERCIVMDGARIGRKVRLRDAIVGCGNLLDQARRTRRPDWSRSPAGVMIIPPRALQGRI